MTDAEPAYSGIAKNFATSMGGTKNAASELWTTNTWSYKETKVDGHMDEKRVELQGDKGRRTRKSKEQKEREGGN